MTEERVLGLAGLFQATALAQQLANTGRCDEAAFEASLDSVFRIDAPSVVEVYGRTSLLRLGLRTMIAQLEDTGSDMAITRMSITVMRLERALARQGALIEELQQGIVAAQRQVEHFGRHSPQVVTRLASLYVSTLSTLKPRVMVTGNPQMLQQEPVVERVRSCLLAAVRSAVLWHQVGGRQWQLLVYRRQCSMLARGLLTGSTLENG
ncbi:high frequency lysogenization protein HflD [Dyella sp.]|jgi:high frequency lysogenization protein|uniref:high frequency lysogenization protein HflD n=1 Tax=Dyella sp. TaxID=1869338 RepID=UPI002D798AC8|nr:high frequency lysogenization protein HflD [Dyella sp.]HET6432384.1 high frequency lysogenization protein HflD [Dyella sp.]